MLVAVTGPTGEPVSLDDLKLHLRIDGRDEDALLAGLITAARQEVEFETGRALMTQTWDLWLDGWPCVHGTPSAVLRIPLPRLQAVAWVKYFDTANGEHTLDASAYYVDSASEPGRVCLAYGQSWPATVLRPINGVQVRFTAGYGDAGSVPPKLAAAIKLVAGWLYENRGDGAPAGPGQSPSQWADAVDRLCAGYAVRMGFA